MIVTETKQNPDTAGRSGRPGQLPWVTPVLENGGFGIHERQEVQTWTFPGVSRRDHPLLEVLAQCLLIVGAALVYFLVRGQTEGSAALSFANAQRILDLEQSMGIAIEASAQGWILGNRVAVTLANWVYIWGHWPVLTATLFVLHQRRSPHYLMLRNAMFVSGAIGIVVFVMLPVAPPRLLDPSYVDTVTDLSTSYRVFQPPGLVNQYAAMPSLHVGWNLLAGIAIVRSTRRWWLVGLGVLSPLAMSAAVVLTANHYVLDAVAGIVVALVGLVVAQQLWGRFYAPRHSAFSGTPLDLRDQGQVVEDEARELERRPQVFAEAVSLRPRGRRPAQPSYDERPEPR